MTAALIFLVVCVVLAAGMIVSQTLNARDNEKRKRELLEHVETLYNSLPLAEGIDLLYIQNLEQIFRDDEKECPREDLEHDCKLLLQLRRKALEDAHWRRTQIVDLSSYYTRSADFNSLRRHDASY